MEYDSIEAEEMRELEAALEHARANGLLTEFVAAFGVARFGGDQVGDAIAFAAREWDL